MIFGQFDGLIALGAIIAAAALIGIIAFVIYKVTHPKLKSEVEKKDEKEAAQEELDRVLQPIEDEKVAKEINEYKEKDD